MSNKPPKKSDSEKQWMKPRRDRQTKLAPEYHLIVTEGEKTEPNYFKGLKDEINQKYTNRISLQIEGVGQGANTLSLLERAQKIVAGEPDRYKHVWLVFDQDDFPKDDFDNTISKCFALSNEDITYHALWSNECVELWFLLHFELLQSGLQRKNYYPKLTDHIGTKYKKNDDNIYQILRPNMKTAIRNAKQLTASNRNKNASKCNPGTSVYEIFDYLKNYLD